MDIQIAGDCIFGFFRSLPPIKRDVFSNHYPALEEKEEVEYSDRNAAVNFSLLMDTKIHFNIFTSMNIFFSFSGK